MGFLKVVVRPTTKNKVCEGPSVVILRNCQVLELAKIPKIILKVQFQ